MGKREQPPLFQSAQAKAERVIWQEMTRSEGLTFQHVLGERMHRERFPANVHGIEVPSAYFFSGAENL